MIIFFMLFSPLGILIHKLVSSFPTSYCFSTNNIITESFPLISYLIRDPLPSYFSPKPKFLPLEPVISGSILVIDPKNLTNVLFVINPFTTSILLSGLLLTYVSKFSAFNLASYRILLIPCILLDILLCTDSSSSSLISFL